MSISGNLFSVGIVWINPQRPTLSRWINNIEFETLPLDGDKLLHANPILTRLSTSQNVTADLGSLSGDSHVLFLTPQCSLTMYIFIKDTENTYNRVKHSCLYWDLGRRGGCQDNKTSLWQWIWHKLHTNKIPQWYPKAGSLLGKYCPVNCFSIYLIIFMWAYFNSFKILFSH